MQNLESAEPGSKVTIFHLPVAAPEPDLLAVTDLKVHFPIYKGLIRKAVGAVKAVDGVSLSLRRGRTMALVGESGCGKTTVGKGILQLIPVSGGSVKYNGIELIGLERKRLREMRAQFQLVFQDPYSSLNPRMRIMEIIQEGMNALNVKNHDKEDSSNRQSDGSGSEVDRLLESVGLRPEAKWRYPHEFSGGQRQRIAIARVLAVRPKLIVCDEPTSALDVSVQAQILNLLRDLQDSLELAYLFITHNISVVEYIADEVAVMYLGRIVESGSVDEVLNSPKHPYTQALLSAVPVIEPESKRHTIRLHGDLPSPANPPSGCHFHPRCPHVMPICREVYPATSRFSPMHQTRCHLYPQQQDKADNGNQRTQEYVYDGR
jgi:peptide/nickel transport system ATP-binding protein